MLYVLFIAIFSLSFPIISGERMRQRKIIFRFFPILIQISGKRTFERQTIRILVFYTIPECYRKFFFQTLQDTNIEFNDIYIPSAYIHSINDSFPQIN